MLSVYAARRQLIKGGEGRGEGEASIYRVTADKWCS